ncbi:P-loop NTPase family protein [Alkaliphilus hydrothermalis]|uniref:MinD-like ATPase involved in chromosome partitioning or flagellar assembly n=1 Tax=Alkaliphilus hydrothermalis TaxID=1482730 RepID=A0ABS2NL41_9FIRM|nr:hypothetical protein [Alkaliphilus hydrothermalis]MBM7613596.1 MinD-like ATPase involved in chromosome partitioning or flagellar assembly [Alkaliphilus hydrothermalis]
MIAITAPKKGLGQTVVSINLAIRMGSLLEDRVLLIDSNKYCCGVVDYLSNSSWTRGLDEFKINIESGMGIGQNPHSWSKTINPRLDIMASNQYLQLIEKDIEKLKEYTNCNYPIALVDTIAGENSLTDIFLKKSSIVIVVLTQNKSEIRLIKDKRLYGELKDKIIFVINQYQAEINAIKIRYGLKEISEELKELGFKQNPIFILPYDVDLVNECNDSTLLNFSMAREHQSSPYHKKLDLLARETLKQHGNLVLTNNIEKVKKKGFVFNLFNL